MNKVEEMPSLIKCNYHVYTIKLLEIWKVKGRDETYFGQCQKTLFFYKMCLVLA